MCLAGKCLVGTFVSLLKSNVSMKRTRTWDAISNSVLVVKWMSVASVEVIVCHVKNIPTIGRIAFKPTARDLVGEVNFLFIDLNEIINYFPIRHRTFKCCVCQ